MSSLTISGKFNLYNGIPLAITTADQAINGLLDSDQIVVQIPGGTAIYYGNFSYTGSRIDGTSSISGYAYATDSLSLSLQLSEPLDMATYFSLAGTPQAFAQHVLSGDDSIDDRGNSMPQLLYGYDGNDTFNMGSGNDVIYGGRGNDQIEGNDGADMALFNGLRRLYSWTGDPSGQASISGPDGNDTLSSVEALAFPDGWLIFAPHAHIAQVSRLYQATLGRNADPLGLNHHTDRLDTGSSLSEIAGDFVNSPEFQSVYGQLSDQAFVETLYHNVLGRPAEAEGLAYWTGRLAAGNSRGEIVTGFSESRENIENHAATYAAGLWDIDETAASVTRLYMVLLSRPPYIEDLLSWTQAINNGKASLLDAAASLLESPEYASRFEFPYPPIGMSGTTPSPSPGTPSIVPGTSGNYNYPDETELFIYRLYSLALGRQADPEGLAYWSGQLKQGASKASVLLGFTESPECQERSLAWLQDGSVAIRRVSGTEGGIISDSPLTDYLFGHAGADQFLFDTPMSPADYAATSSTFKLNNGDKVINFTSGNDKILLDHTVFSALPIGELAASSFVIVPLTFFRLSLTFDPILQTIHAHDESDHILYQPMSGNLLYDADGNGPEPADLIAQFVTELTGFTPLAASDFLIV